MTAYVPILAAEPDRLAGLAATTDDVKSRLTPLFIVPAFDSAAGRVPGPPGAPGPEARGAALARHLSSVVDAVENAFGRRRAYMDAGALDGVRVDDGRTAAAWLLDEARVRGLPLVPVTGLRRTAGENLAAAEAASVDGRGACVRLQLPDFTGGDDLPERVQALADELGLAPAALDLLVDLGRVAAEEPMVLVVAARAVITPLWRAAEWRSIMLAAAGPPQSVPGREADRGRLADALPESRTEWLLWRTLAADQPTLGFGDYAGPDAAAATGDRRADLRGDVPAADRRVVGRTGIAGRRVGDRPAPCPGDVAPGAGRASYPSGDVRAATARHLTVTVERIARAELAAG